MKIIFNIIASSDYTSFKELWIDNIKYFQNNFPEYSEFFEFYFSYNITNESNETDESYRLQSHQTNKTITYFDFYYLNNSKYERKRGIFKRNLAFLKFLKLQNKNIDYKVDYIIRTNLTTLFNIPLFLNWIKTKNLPTQKLLAATMSDCYMEEFSIFSGTNFLISYDLANILLLSEENIEKHYKELNIEYPEDDLLMGQILIQNIQDLNIITINRLDYIECKYTINGIEQYIPPSIIFEKCHYNDEVFCFRFKTLDRNNDCKHLKYILENHIQMNISLETCVKNFKNNNMSLQLVLNQPNYYKEFGEKPFKLNEKILIPHNRKDILFNLF